MQICPDPLEAVRSVGPDHQWCVTLPASYPTLFPYIPTNIEYNGQQTSNTHTFNFDINNDNCTNILDSSLCINNRLIQRIRRKIDLYQTSSLNDTHYSFQRPTNTGKQHVSNSDVKERINQDNQLQPNIQHYGSKSRIPSLFQQAIDKKSINKHVSSKDLSDHFHSSDSSLHSTNASGYSNQTNDSLSQFSSISSLQSLSTDNDSTYDLIDSRSGTVVSISSTDSSSGTSTEMSISVPSIFSTPYISKQQVDSDQSGPYLDDDRISSVLDLKNNGFLSPSYNQERVDRPLSSNHTKSTIRSPKYTLINSNENINGNRRKKEDQNQLSKEIHHDKFKKQPRWFEKPFETRHSTSWKSPASEYKRLASHCYINDYGAWLERQQELMVWLNLAKLLKLPIQDSELIQKEMEQFRLQHECLRVIERLPVSIGPG